MRCDADLPFKGREYGRRGIGKNRKASVCLPVNVRIKNQIKEERGNVLGDGH